MDRGPRTGITEGVSRSGLDLIEGGGPQGADKRCSITYDQDKLCYCCFKGADTHTVENTNAVLECVLSLLTVLGQV